MLLWFSWSQSVWWTYIYILYVDATVVLARYVRYWLQAPWGWNDSVETCRSVIISEIIVHLLVTVQNNKICTVHVLKQNWIHYFVVYLIY